ncbi:hypothetical protein C8T65DRAFT_737022 [Cerioporus squamosus]|nr:hypothetical protein C8T65DRAFT_737022 [Cerioporus squamosus]
MPIQSTLSAPAKITTVAEGSIIDLPGHDPHLPEMYLVDAHPLVPEDRYSNKIYVFVQDTTPAAMGKYYNFLAKAPFPEGTEEGVSDAGYLHLKPGDYVLVRDANGDGAPEHDLLQLWVTAK